MATPPTGERSVTDQAGDGLKDVFLSHSHRDEARARALAKRLEGWGVTVYSDKIAKFNDPAVALEFMVAGPMRLYRAWLASISDGWRLPDR